MIVTRIVKSLAMAAAVLTAGVASASYPIYSTSFEAPTYTAGNSINGVDGWNVPGGTVTVTANGGGTNAQDGSQYVTLSAGSTLQRTISNTDNVNLIWVQGYFRGTGSSVTLASANYTDTNASAIVHFSQQNGIEMENGNGLGTAGTPVGSGVMLNPTTWYKITIQLNFTPDGNNHKTWKLWVNNVRVPSNGTQTFGFRNDSVTKLNGFQNLAQSQSLFDDFRVIKPILGDANGDALVDSADLIRLLSYVSGGVPDIIVKTDSDIDADGDVDAMDVDHLTMIIMGEM